MLGVQCSSCDRRQRDPLVRRPEKDIKVWDAGRQKSGSESRSSRRQQRASVQLTGVEKVRRRPERIQRLLRSWAATAHLPLFSVNSPKSKTPLSRARWINSALYCATDIVLVSVGRQRERPSEAKQNPAHVLYRNDGSNSEWVGWLLMRARRGDEVVGDSASFYRDQQRQRTQACLQGVRGHAQLIPHLIASSELPCTRSLRCSDTGSLGNPSSVILCIPVNTTRLRQHVF